MLFLGCEEVPPEVNFGAPTGLGDRVVVVEEFTGVQCVFCPPGAEEIENLLTLYPENLIAISVHNGFFATPVPGKNQFDFRTEDGNFLETFLGQPDKGYPSSVINRKEFPGEGSLHTPQPTWAGYVAQEVAQEAVIGVNLTATYDPATRELRANVIGIAREDIDHPVRMTVLVVEDGIIDYQKDIRFGDVPDYEHKHVLRDIITTNPEGDMVAPNGLLSGVNLSFEVTTIIPEEWKVEKCKVIAFATNADNKEILQADEIGIVD